MQEQLNQLIHKSINRERFAQAKLYEVLAPEMFVVCMRYSRNREEAEEALQEGFLNVFENLHKFKFAGSFEGWVRKILLNCALQKFRSSPQLHTLVNMGDSEMEYSDTGNIYSQLESKELIKLVQMLPPVYRLVFNLHVFEGIKHKEIARLLKISEGTSKSNLFGARSILQKAVRNFHQMPEKLSGMYR